MYETTCNVVECFEMLRWWWLLVKRDTQSSYYYGILGRSYILVHVFVSIYYNTHEYVPAVIHPVIVTSGKCITGSTPSHVSDACSSET